VTRGVPPADDRWSPGFFYRLKQLAGVDGNASFFWVMEAGLAVGGEEFIDYGFRRRLSGIQSIN
jgi:hypothetical protein